MESEIKDLNDPSEIINTIKNLINEPEFNNYAETTALKMVTQLFNDSGKTWRQAARANSQGRTIYEALKKELQGTINGPFNFEINRNAHIIKTLPLDISQKVTAYVAEEATKGRTATAIAKEIQVMFPKSSKAKANLIARTEVSKTSTALTKARAESMQLDYYVWESSNDQRVRRSHNHMQDVLVNWKDTPSPERLIGEKFVGNYDAGCIWNCRCYAAPLVSEDLISWPHKVYRYGQIVTMSLNQFKKIM